MLRFLPLLLVLILACGDDDSPRTGIVIEEFEFDGSDEGWEAALADYEAGTEDSIDLVAEVTTLPAPLPAGQGAFRLSATNLNQDLFVFLRRPLSGLTPNQVYEVNYEVDYAAGIADSTITVDGAPGENVYVKLGATAEMPVARAGSGGDLILSVNKGNNIVSGTAAYTLGDLSNGLDRDEFVLKNIGTSTPITVMADADGVLWLFVGTDSAYKGRSTIYWDRIRVGLRPVG